MLIYTAAFAHFFVSALAQQASYNVISSVTADAAAGMAVVVDDKSYPMHQDTSLSSLLFSASAPRPEKGYHYAKVDATGSILESEPFNRKPFDGDATPNEHYNRTWNTWRIPQLPQALDPLPVINRIDSKLHIDGEIPTIHITGDDQAIQNMHKNDGDDIKVSINMTHISLHDVQTFSGVEFEISGHSSRQAPKLAYNLKLPKKTYLYGYRRLKLRSLGTDPSYIREDLGYKMLHAAGVPTTDSSYVRVYLNNQPLGLFGFIEKFKNPWLRNEFNDGKKGYQQGTLYQSKSKAGGPLGLFSGNLSDLSYYGDQEQSYLFQYKTAEDPSSKEKPNFSALIQLTNFLDNASSTTKKEAWEAHFDMESVMRGVALEFLMGFGDSYLTAFNNYYIYQTAPDSSKFMFLLYDIDHCMGSTPFVKMSQIETGDWHKFTNEVSKRPLMKFTQVPEYARRFDQLIQELNDKLLNLDVIGQRIDDTVAMLQEDVAWDKSCPRVSKANFSSDSDILAMEDKLDQVKSENLDLDTFYKYNQRMRDGDIGFIQAVNGPTHYESSLVGLKEFIKIKHQNVVDHYSSSNQ